MGAMQRADTLKPGEYQVLVETSVQSAVGEDLGGGPRMSWPYFAAHYRRGLSEGVEFSVGAAMLALQGSLKVRLDDPLTDGVLVSIAPAIGGSIWGEEENQSGILTATLPVLLGWRVGKQGQIVLSPRAQFLQTFPSRNSTRAPLKLFGVGTSLGALVPLTRNVGIMPEVSLLVPFGTERFELYERSSPRIGAAHGVLFQVGLGLLLGGLSEPDAEGEAR